MTIPCANQACSEPALVEAHRSSANRFGLCHLCQIRLTRRLVPTCGLIPSDALRAIAKDLLSDHLKPSPSDIKTAVRFARGSRHREGDWEQRPVYSAPIVHSHSPRAPMSRRMPELLVGRRRAPQASSIIAAYTHNHLARQCLGLGHKAAVYLAGATFFGRRAMCRPTGVRRVYRGREVSNTFHLGFYEFTAIGRHALLAADLMGVDKSCADFAVVRYQSGVAAGEFNPPIIVSPDAGITTGAGDHPLDHWLPRSIPYAPEYNRKIRRASGRLHGGGEYPAALDVPLVERAAIRKQHRRSFTIQTTTAPSTDWLFASG